MKNFIDYLNMRGCLSSPPLRATLMAVGFLSGSIATAQSHTNEVIKEEEGRANQVVAAPVKNSGAKIGVQKTVAVKNPNHIYVQGQHVGTVLKSFGANEPTINGMVKDLVNELIWSPKSDKKMNYTEALEYCQKLNLGKRKWYLAAPKDFETIFTAGRPGLPKRDRMALTGSYIWMTSDFLTSQGFGDKPRAVIYNGTLGGPRNAPVEVFENAPTTERLWVRCVTADTKENYEHHLQRYADQKSNIKAVKMQEKNYNDEMKMTTDIAKKYDKPGQSAPRAPTGVRPNPGSNSGTTTTTTTTTYTYEYYYRSGRNRIPYR